MNIVPAEDEVVCREDAQAYPRTLSTWTLSPALGVSHCRHQGHRGSSSHVSLRVWSHDLALANRCVLSPPATVIGSGLVR